MIGYINQALALAKASLYLLLFANNIELPDAGLRALTLVSDVSGFVLKEADNVLADYNARDQLLHKVIQQLQILDGLAYGAWRAMYWAKERGIIASSIPLQSLYQPGQSICQPNHSERQIPKDESLIQLFNLNISIMKKFCLILLLLRCMLHSAQVPINDEAFRYQQQRMVFQQWDQNKFNPAKGFLDLNPYYWLVWGFFIPITTKPISGH